MPYPILGEDTQFVESIEDGFVRAFRKKLTAAEFFTERRVPDLGFKKYTWRDITDLDGARLTMEIPDLSQSDSGVVTEQSVEIPVFTRDIHFDGRQWLAYQRTGLLSEDEEQAGRIMAEEMNDYLYLGSAAFTGTFPGPSTGLLNHADINTVDNTATGAWTVPEDVNNDIAEAIRKIMDSTEGDEQGPFVLLMNPVDADLLERFRTETDTKTRDIVTSLVSAVRFDNVVTGTFDDAGAAQNGEAFLFPVDGSTWWDAVTALGLGNVLRILKEGDTMMGEGIWMRFLASAVPRVKKGEVVCKITIDR